MLGRWVVVPARDGRHFSCSVIPGRGRIVYKCAGKSDGFMPNKILLVEDNVELVELWRLRLEAEGLNVVTAGDGVEALKKARALEPDLMVLDLVLPELDGFALCETLRGERRFSTTPILLITGLTSDLARYAGLEAGADDYLRKPISPDELVSKIRHWLKAGRKPGQRLSLRPKAAPAWTGLQ